MVYYKWFTRCSDSGPGVFCPGAKLPGCQVARVPDARVGQMPGCQVARVTFVCVPTPGLVAADMWMMVIILGLWPQGHNPMMVTIISLSPGSTQPAVYMIHTRLGGPYPRSFPFDFTIG